jgi:hypothetical protein
VISYESAVIPFSRMRFAHLKGNFAYKTFTMQNDEKKVAELMAEIAYLKESKESLQQLYQTSAYLTSIYEQKNNWIKKHHPTVYKQSDWEISVVNIAKEAQSIKDYNFLDIAFFN